MVYEPKRIKVASLFIEYIKAIISGQKKKADLYIKMFLQNFFIKAKSWEHEKEYRIVYSIDENSDGINVPVYKLGMRTRRIVAGINCSEDNKKKLNEISNLFRFRKYLHRVEIPLRRIQNGLYEI